jgi:ubiquinone/menaquinone biosynthesis C-methylase UbiE
MAALRFDEHAAARLERTYMSPDIVRQREVTLIQLQLKPGESVIDIGSGPGFLCESMATQVGPSGRVHGIDISEHLVQGAQRRNSKAHLTYKVGNATALDAQDGVFDVAVSTQVFEYVADCDRAIAEMHRVLKPGGRGIVVATDWDGVVWRSSDRARMRTMLDVWEAHCADPRLPRSLGPRLRAAGLEVSEVAGHPIINTRLGEETYSQGIMQLIGAFVRRQKSPIAMQVDDWLADLAALDVRGEYFFSLTRFMFLVRKT